MEDVNAIHRIFKNLKYEMDNNGWVYQWDGVKFFL